MFWPYAFFTFIISILFKVGFPMAATIASLTAAGFLLLDLKRIPKKLLWTIIAGTLLGGYLFFLRIDYLNLSGKFPLSADAEVTGVSRKSVIVQTDAKQKLRLTGFTKEQIPAKHARIAFRCEVQEVSESTFMIFERLSGVSAWCRVKEIRILETPTGPLTEFRRKTLRYLNARFDAMSFATDGCGAGTPCAPGERSLIAAFLLGDTEGLSPQELDAFRDMGLMHLFAVSGLNIALLFAILYLPFRAAKIPAVGAALGYAVATAFLLLLDFPVPLLRAWLFMTIGLGMRVIDRRIPSWTLLFLTAILVELFFPLSTFSMSFILSFGVTAAILVFYEPLHFCFAARNRALNLLSEHAALTFAAGLPALLLGHFLFGTAHPLSLLYNLLLVPFSGLYLFISLVFMAFEPAKHILFALDSLYLKFASFHTQYVSANFPSAEKKLQYLSLLCVALLLACLYYLKKRRRLWSARRNLRYIIPAMAAFLLLPYFFATYPTTAIYAVPNKVWLYSERRIAFSGNPLFTQGQRPDPRYCFPVRGISAAPQRQNQPLELLMFEKHCFLFTGRMKPETWAPDILSSCASLDVFQSKKMHTAESEWGQLFRLFGFRGQVTVRQFFTWYADQPLSCGKSNPL